MGKKISKHTSSRERMRRRRHTRVRSKMFGTAEKPRLCVYRSNKHIYAQVIDDSLGRTLAAASTLSENVREKAGENDKKSAAKLVGTQIAKKCLEQKIEQIVFDRGGYLYTGGRVRALAEAAREAGLKF